MLGDGLIMHLSAAVKVMLITVAKNTHNYSLLKIVQVKALKGKTPVLTVLHKRAFRSFFPYCPLLHPQTTAKQWYSLL